MATDYETIQWAVFTTKIVPKLLSIKSALTSLSHEQQHLSNTTLTFPYYRTIPYDKKKKNFEIPCTREIVVKHSGTLENGER